MSSYRPIIDVVHPTGNQNLRQVLQALEETNQLGTFHTTLGFSSPSWTSRLPGPLRTECVRRTYDLPAERLHARPRRELARLVAQRLGWHALTHHETGWASVDQVYRSLDVHVARSLSGRAAESVTAVYGYEDGCLETFRAAKQLGLRRIYDLPIAYWQVVQKLLEEEKERLPEWEPTLVGTRDSAAKLQRKTEELSLAHVVVCPSLFVLRSLPVDVQKNRACIVAEFGSPVVSKEVPPRAASAKNKLRVLFAGSMTQRKGLADVFAAMKLLKRQDVELIVMGSPLASMEFYRSQYADFTYLSTRPHREVLELMRGCDVLVLPSLAEGRALVQQEAMANGLPLIITENTGGEDLIVEGETGFLVPIRNPRVIAEKIAWLADHPAARPEMRTAAIRKAAEYPWQRYRDRIAAAVRNIQPETVA
jgi:glycosyltransferase involved in cell wall biosynthesis